MPSNVTVAPGMPSSPSSCTPFPSTSLKTTPEMEPGGRGVGVGVEVLVGVAVLVGVLVGVAVWVGVLVEVTVWVAVLVGVGV